MEGKIEQQARGGTKYGVSHFRQAYSHFALGVCPRVPPIMSPCTSDEDFFMKMSETFESAIDTLQEIEREKAFVREQRQKSFAGSERGDEQMLLHVTGVLRLLQLLCEGHHRDMQNYIRHQWDNLYSFNMVTEVVSFLRSLVFMEPDDALVEVATQVLRPGLPPFRPF